MKKRIVLGSIVLAFAAAIAAWAWLQSPYFALRELRTAIETKDLAAFYRRVDIDALYSSAVDALATKGLAEAKDDPDLLDKIRSSFDAGIDKVARSQSIDLIKHEIAAEFLRDRKAPAPLPEGKAGNMLRAFLHDTRDVSIGNWVYAERGVLVNAEFALLKMGKTYPLTFRMLPAGNGQWRLAEFEGLSSLLVQYEQDRGARVAAYNEGLEASLAERLPFFGEARVEGRDQGLSSLLHLDCLWQNKGTEEVVRIRGEIRDATEPPKLRADFDSEPMNLPAGEKKVFLIKKDQFLSPKDDSFQGMALRFLYHEVRFADGAVLKRVQDFDEIPPQIR